MRAKDLMTKRAATVRPTDDLGRAARRMEDHDCGSVVVVDEDGRTVGILTDRDVCLAVARADRAPSELRVRDHAHRVVHTCGPDDPVGELERRMGEHQVRRLPVVDADGHLLGVVSLDDIAAEARREASLIRPQVSAKDVGRTLGEVGRPHLETGD